MGVPPAVAAPRPASSVFPVCRSSRPVLGQGSSLGLGLAEASEPTPGRPGMAPGLARLARHWPVRAVNCVHWQGGRHALRSHLLPTGAHPHHPPTATLFWEKPSPAGKGSELCSPRPSVPRDRRGGVEAWGATLLRPGPSGGLGAAGPRTLPGSICSTGSRAPQLPSTSQLKTGPAPRLPHPSLPPTHPAIPLAAKRYDSDSAIPTEPPGPGTPSGPRVLASSDVDTAPSSRFCRLPRLFFSTAQSYHARSSACPPRPARSRSGSPNRHARRPRGEPTPHHLATPQAAKSSATRPVSFGQRQPTADCMSWGRFFVAPRHRRRLAPSLPSGTASWPGSPVPRWRQPQGPTRPLPPP